MRNEVRETIIDEIKVEPQYAVTLISGKEVKKALTTVLVEAGFVVERFGHSVAVDGKHILFRTKINMKGMKKKNQITEVPGFDTNVDNSDPIMEAIGECKGLLYDSKKDLKYKKTNKKNEYIFVWDEETVLRNMVGADEDDDRFEFEAIKMRTKKKKKIEYYFKVAQQYRDYDEDTDDENISFNEE